MEVYLRRFLTQERTDKYNIMCCLVPNDLLQLDYKYDERIIGDGGNT